MSELFRKLNLGSNGCVVVLNAPAEFEPLLAELQDVAVERVLPQAGAEFVLGFARSRADLEPLVAAVLGAVAEDGVVWFAYPKASSKRYRSDFNRDQGWEAIGAAGYEGVRQVSIDADWSALRFRKAALIKKLTRDPARRISTGA